MDTAGNALYAIISSKEIDLGDIPDWFKKEPKGWDIDSTGQDKPFCSWDLYWLSAIKWLAENKPNSGITFPSSIGRIKAGEHLVSIQGVNGLLITLLHLRNENLKRAWLGLAKSSEDVCSYLADMLASEQKKGEKPKSQPAKSIKYWFKFVCKVIVGLGILLGILWTAIQIYESATFKQFVMSRHKSQSVYDPNAQTESNDITLSSKTNHDTSNSLPDLNLPSPESPNQ